MRDRTATPIVRNWPFSRSGGGKRTQKPRTPLGRSGHYVEVRIKKGRPPKEPPLIL